MIFVNTAEEYRFPYVWQNNIRNQLNTFCNVNGFKHVHIQGDAGFGKTRCVYEILKSLQNTSRKLLIATYTSQNAELNHVNPVDVFASQLGLYGKTDNAISGFSQNLSDKDFLQILRRESRSKRILLVVEDLHYTDDLRDNILDKMVAMFSEQNVPVTLITSSRNDWPLLKHSRYDSITLDKLDHPTVMALIQAGSKRYETIRNFQSDLVYYSDGNPLYIYEAMKYISQHHELNIHDLQNIDSIYTHYLQECNCAQKEVLEAAAVIGLQFHKDELKYLLPHLASHIDSVLDQLHDLEILFFNEDGAAYTFAHAIQREGILRNIETVEKQALHVALFELYKKNKNFELCGYHLFETGFYEKSIPYLTYAARKLLKNAQPNRAEILFKKAFEAYQKSSNTHKPSYFKLRIDLCHTYIMRGEVFKMEENINELEKLVSTNSIANHRQLFLNIEVPYKWVAAKYDRNYIANLLEQTPDNAETLPNKFRMLGMLIDLGYFREAANGIHGLLNGYLKSTSFFTGKSFTPVKTTLYATLANVYAQLGQEDLIDETIGKCLEYLKESDNPARTIFGYAFCAKALQAVGRYDEAEPYIAHSYKTNLECQIGIVTPDVLSIYADNLTNRNNVISALKIFDELMDFIGDKGIVSNHALHLTLQAIAFEKIKMSQVSQSLLVKAIDIAEKHNNPYQKAYAAVTLATLLKKYDGLNDGGMNDHALLKMGRDIAVDLGAVLLLRKCDGIIQ